MASVSCQSVSHNPPFPCATNVSYNPSQTQVAEDTYPGPWNTMGEFHSKLKCQLEQLILHNHSSEDF